MPNPILSSLILPVKDQTTGEVTNVEYDLPASGSSITVDEEISATSTNPVQNKVISEALDEKANTEDLGTAASRDVPTSGNANVTQVVIGSDTRLTNARPASDVSDWAKADTKPTYTAAEVGAIPTTEKGANSGVAELDENGKVPSSQLPSYVDDVLEYESVDDLPLLGETGKIYVVLDTNKTYRWSGSAYVVISPSLALGETSSTAYRGDRGKTAYDHSQTTSGNPHNVTKSDVGLGNVGNFKAVSTVASQGLTDTEKSNARANIGAGTSSFSGSYNDLTNKPTIPTVNNATLTIQKNGTNVQTFTANQSSNATANITVPTKVSELTNDSGYTTNTGTVTQVKVGSTAYNPSSGVISLPAYPTDTNTHRPIQVNGTEILGNNTTALNLKAGSNVSVTNSSGTVTIAATDTTYGVVSTSANGLAPKVTDTSKYLKGDGTWATPTNTDTKNTAGSTDTSSKIFLIGATSQAANPQTYSHDTAYVGTDGCLYSGGSKVLTAHDGNNRRGFYGTCATAAATAAKVVTLSSTAGWELVAGTIVGIKFTNTNTAGSATLNVNSSGAKSIWYNGAAYTGTEARITGWAGHVIYYMYDGTYWCFLNNDQNYINTNTTYSVVSSSANGLAPKVTDTSKYLKGDGTWATPTNTDTKNTAGSTDTSSKIFLIGATSQAANPQTYSHDTAYVGTDGCLYSGGSKVLTAHDGNNRRVFYGTCATAAATAAKVVTLSDTTGWELKAGTTVVVRFTYTNTASNVTLNVNSSGAKSIYYNNAKYTGSSSDVCGYAARTYVYTYDGTYWVWVSHGVDNNTTYSSKAAASGGTDVSLVTTGEKYIWNNKGTGTVTSVKVGTTSYSPSSGVVSLPAYPTVNNAILTIQKNGTNVQTFTANQSTNVTANITVPTVVDNHTSTSTSNALAANQGKVIWDYIQKLSGTKSFLNVGADTDFINTYCFGSEHIEECIFFSNWADSTNFPEIYGSGVLMSCTDSSERVLIYVCKSLNAYIGRYKLNSNNTVTKTWRKITTTA